MYQADYKRKDFPTLPVLCKQFLEKNFSVDNFFVNFLYVDNLFYQNGDSPVER